MDFTPILTWWLVISIFGLVGWPLAFSLFRFLPDRGFALARPLGLMVVGYLLWLGATFRLLQNSVGSIVVVMLLVLGGGLLWHRQQVGAGANLSMLTWFRQEWRYAFIVELLFNAALIGWAIYKAYNPNIETVGGEKWMEIAFINGILRSDYFPPQDPWLSGFGISYYYFGYVLMSMMTQLAGLASVIAFNLYVPTLFAMTLAGACGLVANLVALYHLSDHPAALWIEPPFLRLPAVLTGLLGALFVAILGNLIGVLEVLHKGGMLPASFWIWLDIRDLKVPPAGPGESWIPDRFLWWWRGSRVLTDYNLLGEEQEVIDEFPFFSFLLGDVHPHVLALPFVLLAVGLALNMVANTTWPRLDNRPEETSLTPIDKLKKFGENNWHDLQQAMGGRLAFGLYAICIGGLSFLNTWDFPIYLSVVGLALLIWLAQSQPDWSSALFPAFTGMSLMGVISIVLYLPFYATFQSQARGILPNLWNPTRLPQFFVFFGPFLVAIVGLLLVLALKHWGWQKHLGSSILLTVLGPPLVLLIVLSALLFSPAGQDYIQGILNNPAITQVIGDTTIAALIQESLARRIAEPWTFLVLGMLLGLTLALLAGLKETNVGLAPGQAGWRVEKFVLGLLLVGLGLPLTVEFIFLRDNFGYRMNTIFKFYFQAWVLMGLVSAFAVYYVSKNLRGLPRLAWQGVMVLLVAGGMIYPILATLNKTNNFQNEPTLNGIAWIAQHRPDDYAGIQWLQEHAPDSAIILEAPGSGGASYQYTGRVSALTGLPTLLGWGGHQSQWRGNYDEPGRREPEIDLIFNTSDLDQARRLLDKYNISYVYVGPLERERYSPQGLKKFDPLMEVAFQQGDVTIYQRIRHK